ncbi:hypothetical protein LX70_00265 [Defluviimonas denitrificans]|jgi:hypothetical protein|uniref:Lipoprotein n=1 Tax=Albidovulum denitrificans TaxID=404881 RepID=A0A2S8SCF2_9RHOB|nr:DUF6778 family protein [Defluviimonas denitrificans]MCB1410679.1 hypothetical protein [Paracoccaceae bacterium]PQV58453.1 hypothetical protein LX70_00265 [Defluviimonas denitrificans]
MRIGNRLVKLASAMALVVLAGCSGTFRTYYDDPVPAAQSANWRLSSVHVTAPRSLVVSEEEVFVPKADIVWREDPSGNRYEQVEALMQSAIARGAAGLHGSRPVTIEATMVRFHAMTMLAEAKAPAGVHNVEFNMTIRDARTGAVLYGPEFVEASFPAMTGAQMARARAAGQSQRSQISNNVALTIRGLLGLGPDARKTFSGIGA